MHRIVSLVAQRQGLSVEKSSHLILARVLLFDLCMWTAFEVLGLKDSASLHQIRSRYHLLCHYYHPDKSKEAAGFYLLQEIFKILSDSKRRAKEAHIRKYKFRLYHENNLNQKSLVVLKNWEVLKAKKKF